MFGSLTNFDSLFDQFRRMEEQMDELFGTGFQPPAIRSVARGTYPPINMGETSEGVDIYLFAAGLNPKSINLSIQQNLLTVSGERKLETNQKATYYRQERFNGGFQRVIALPQDVDPERVQAKYVDGVLHIKAPKRETAKRRQINVQ